MKLVQEIDSLPVNQIDSLHSNQPKGVEELSRHPKPANRCVLTTRLLGLSSRIEFRTRPVRNFNPFEPHSSENSKMPKSFLLLVLAAGCGLAAMLFFNQFMSKSESNEPHSIKVLVAKTDIKTNVPLDDQMVEFQERPADQVPIGAVQTMEQYSQRALRVAAKEGEVILTSKLGEKGDYLASAEIPPGYRVLTVPITPTTSHSGQIRPHDRVDIYVTYKAKEEPTDRSTTLNTKMILEYIEVFAMGADRYSDSAADDQILAKNASLLVTTKQAQILMMAQSKGELELALRPKDETATAIVDPLTEAEFDAIGTDISARQKHQEEIENLKAEMMSAHEQELAELAQKSTEQISLTIEDIKQKYTDEQKRRDGLHAETLAGLEAKNVELQTLLQKAIDESTDKESLAESLLALQSRNGQLKKLLDEAKARAASQVPIVIEEKVFEPEVWKLRVLSGREETVSEFILNKEESEEELKGKKSSDSKPVEEETSTKYSPKNGNTAP